MPIKKANVASAGTAKAGVSMPEVVVRGTFLQKYYLAAEALKEAEAIVKDLKPQVLKVGVQEVLSLNTEAGTNKYSSVKLIDQTGAEVRVTMQDSYPAADEAAVSDVFDNELITKEGSKADVSDYVLETAKASFDSNVFIRNDEFDQERYDLFYAAIKSVADRLGVPVPLSTKKVVTAKPSFHENRFKQFSLPQQLRINEVLPCKTMVAALKPGELPVDQDKVKAEAAVAAIHDVIAARQQR